MELVLILTALLVAAFLFSLILVILLYCGRENKQKGTYLTGEKAAKNGNSVDCGVGRMDGSSKMMGELDLGWPKLYGELWNKFADLSPPLPLLPSSATNSSLISGGGGGHQVPPDLLQISPLTVQGLATTNTKAHREKQPLLCSMPGELPLDFNQNCVSNGQQQLIVQCQGPRHSLPPIQQSTKTLLTF